MKTKIDQLKLDSHMMAPTTEQLFYIESPPEFQCEKMDRINEFTNKALKEINNAQSNLYDEEYSDAHGDVDDAEYYLNYIEDTVEELRSEIEALRAWGKEWKEFAKRLINENEIDMDQYI